MTPEATLDWTAPVSPTPAPATQLPRLRVDGREITDGTRALRLRGVNVCAFEFDRDGANWEGVLDAIAQEWLGNAVRMPVNQQWFLEDDAYVARIERLIDDANERGVYVLLEVQWERGERTEPYHANILEIPTFGPGNTTEAFWYAATSRFANRTNVLYDLINEAHGVPDVDTAAAMQTLVDAIRVRDGETIIVVSGMDWAHTVDFYRERPLDGANLVYSAHPYLPYDPPESWDAKWRRTAAVRPVILGEFLGDVKDEAYALALVDAAEAAGCVGWLPWAVGCGFSIDPKDGAAAALKERMRTLAGGAVR